MRGRDTFVARRRPLVHLASERAEAKMDVKSFATIRRFDASKMQKVALFESERFFCAVYCLLPGEEQKAHAHEGSDKVYAVLEGTIEVRVAEETRTLSQGEAAL